MLNKFLHDQRAALLKRWRELVLAAYPPDARRFFSREKNQFANPVGSALARGLEAILDELIGDMDRDRLLSALDDVIRVRAVQDFSPSRAAGFMFDLKTALRERLAEEKGAAAPAELWDFEDRIDRTALLAFDVFMQCRDQVQELRNRELRNRVQVLERVSLRNQGPAAGSDEKGDD